MPKLVDEKCQEEWDTYGLKASLYKLPIDENRENSNYSKET